MDEVNCPERVNFLVAPYHRSIVNSAMRSGRYVSISEYIRESIEINGIRLGYVKPHAPQGDGPCLKA